MILINHFGLGKVPFARDLPTDQLFLWPAFEEGLARLRFTLGVRGIALLTGEIGSGKSTLIRRFQAELDPTHSPLYYLADSGLDPRGFYREVLSQLGITPGFHRGDARRQFQALFTDAYKNQQKTPVIVLDELHLVSGAMIHELRFLTNFDVDSDCPFALVLVGQAELRGMLRLRAFSAIAQRITTRFHLAGLTQQQTEAYVSHQLKLAGAQRPIFAPGAVETVHTHARGLPRLINQLCLQALLDAAAQDQPIVETDHVRRVLAELQE